MTIMYVEKRELFLHYLKNNFIIPKNMKIYLGKDESDDENSIYFEDNLDHISFMSLMSDLRAGWNGAMFYNELDASKLELTDEI